MDKNNKQQSNVQNCSCSIDDILEGNDTKNDQICENKADDIEIFVDPDPEKISYNFYIRRMTDGLPIIPPTGERVRKFLNYTYLKPDDIIGVLPPRQGKSTAEKVAINSVMAGCQPQFMPVIQHGIEAISNKKFNLTSVNSTTHPVSVCMILNGPIPREIGAASGVGCLGPGNLANASIGRALRLCLINIAGAVPGIGDHATMGSPAKYSYVFAEEEFENPWEPLHVELGFECNTSTSTVIAVEAPHNVNDHRSKNAEDLLETISNTISTAGCNNSHVPGEILVIMSPEHARTISKDGLSKYDVKKLLHEKCVVPAEYGDKGGRKLDDKWIVNENVPLTRSPKDVILVIAGGCGRHTMIAHGFGTSSESVTKPIISKNGTPVHSIKEYEVQK